MSSPKGLTGVIPVARSRLSIVVSVGGLALFLVVASFLLSLYPVGLFSQRYFLEGGAGRPSLVSLQESHTKVVASSREWSQSGYEEIVIKEPSPKSEEKKGSAPVTELSSDEKKEVGITDGSVPQNTTEIDKNLSIGVKNDSQKASSEINNVETIVPSPPSELKIENGKPKSSKFFFSIVFYFNSCFANEQ